MVRSSSPRTRPGTGSVDVSDSTGVRLRCVQRGGCNAAVVSDVSQVVYRRWWRKNRWSWGQFAVQVGLPLNHATAQIHHSPAHQAALPSACTGRSCSKRSPESTREQCEGFQRATPVVSVMLGRVCVCLCVSRSHEGGPQVVRPQEDVVSRRHAGGVRRAHVCGLAVVRGL
jgi:hypothetical protein